VRPPHLISVACLAVLPACEVFGTGTLVVDGDGSVTVAPSDIKPTDVDAAPGYAGNTQHDPFPFGETTAWTRLSAGWEYACAVGIDQEITCIGSDRHGETHPPPGPWIDVFAGEDGTCGRRLDGSVECWGFNDLRTQYEIGGQHWPQTNGWQDLDIGTFATCAIGADGAVTCSMVQLGVLPPRAGPFGSVSAGYGVACGILQGTTRYDCWPYNPELDGYEGPSGAWVDVEVSAYTACGVRTDGTLACWGDVDPSQGIHGGVGANVPQDNGYVDLDIRGEDACGLKASGEVVCWDTGGLYSQTLTGDRLPADWQFIDVSVGLGFACGRNSSGNINCWGNFPAPIE